MPGHTIASVTTVSTMPVPDVPSTVRAATSSNDPATWRATNRDGASGGVATAESECWRTPWSPGSAKLFLKHEESQSGTGHQDRYGQENVQSDQHHRPTTRSCRKHVNRNREHPETEADPKRSEWN